MDYNILRLYKYLQRSAVCCLLPTSWTCTGIWKWISIAAITKHASWWHRRPVEWISNMEVDILF